MPAQNAPNENVYIESDLPTSTTSTVHLPIGLAHSSPSWNATSSLSVEDQSIFASFSNDGGLLHSGFLSTHSSRDSLETPNGEFSSSTSFEPALHRASPFGAILPPTSSQPPPLSLHGADYINERLLHQDLVPRYATSTFANHSPGPPAGDDAGMFFPTSHTAGGDLQAAFTSTIDGLTCAPHPYRMTTPLNSVSKHLLIASPDAE